MGSRCWTGPNRTSSEADPGTGARKARIRKAHCCGRRSGHRPCSRVAAATADRRFRRTASPLSGTGRERAGPTSRLPGRDQRLSASDSGLRVRPRVADWQRRYRANRPRPSRSPRACSSWRFPKARPARARPCTLPLWVGMHWSAEMKAPQLHSPGCRRTTAAPPIQRRCQKPHLHRVTDRTPAWSL